MKSFLLQFLLGSVAFVVSLFGTFFWLFIPLILQVIVDKAIVQNSPDSLNVLGLFLLLATLIASASEVGLAALIAVFVRGGLVCREIFLQVGAALPKVLVFWVVMPIYSPQIAVVSTVLAAIACGAYYFFKKGRIGTGRVSEPLPLSFRLPLTLIVVFVLWDGASLVLAVQLTLGQWLAIGIFTLQFVASALSLTAAALGMKKNG